METNGTPAAGNGGGKPNNDYESLDDFLSASKTALTNAQLPEIAPLLLKRGYPAALLATKRAELDTLELLDAAQATELGQKLQATRQYATARQTLKTGYTDHITFARRLFKDDVAAKTALSLRGERLKSNSGYATQGTQFYQNALDSEAYIAKLATKGVTREELEAGQAGFKNLATLAAVQTDESAQSLKATANRDKLWDALDAWMTEFYESAEIALRDFPEMGKKLGL